MAQLNQLSSPTKVKITTPSLEIDDVIEASINFDPELHEHFNGSSRFPHYVIGNDNTTIKFKTTDRAVIASLIKGMIVSDVEIEFAGPTTAVSDTTPDYTSDTTTIKASLSCAMVIEAIEISNDAEKKAAEFEVTLRACVDPEDGSDPTLEFDFGGDDGDGNEGPPE